MFIYLAVITAVSALFSNTNIYFFFCVGFSIRLSISPIQEENDTNTTIPRGKEFPKTALISRGKEQK
jgi:hypothetical protein